MSLTEEQIAHFMQHGYVAVPDFFMPAETAAIRTEVERLKAEGKLRNVTTDGDGQTPSTQQQNLQLCPMSPVSPLFRALPFHPKIVAAVSGLIGDPVVLHLDQVFLKPGKHGVGTNWHQDNAYFRIENPFRGTAMWIAVHAATVANGTLHVIPDVTNQIFAHSRDPFSDHHIRCYPDETQAVSVELPAGGVVFFAYGTPHCTHGNTTENERAGVAFHFLNEDQLSTANGLSDPKMKHPRLTGPQADNGVSAYEQNQTEVLERFCAHRAN